MKPTNSRRPSDSQPSPCRECGRPGVVYIQTGKSPSGEPIYTPGLWPPFVLTPDAHGALIGLTRDGLELQGFRVDGVPPMSAERAAEVDLFFVVERHVCEEAP